MGIERAMLALLIDEYKELQGGRTETTESTKETEIMLALDNRLAPIKVAVLPLVKNKPELVKKAKEIYKMLKPHFSCQYDETGSIGRRYRRQDEIGTVFAITVDFQTLEDKTVTLRNRDTMKQERIEISELTRKISAKLAY